MTVKHYFTFLKRWWKLIVLGVALGSLAGLFYSSRQAPVYQASSRLMFVQQKEIADAGLSYLSDRNMAETLTALIIARPVLNEAGTRLAYELDPERVTAAQVGDSNVIEVTVTDGNPDRAADAANAIVDVFIAQQRSMRSSLFASSEESLKVQIDQVKAQIDALQGDAVEEAIRLKAEQVAALEQSIKDIRAEISTRQRNLVELRYTGTPVPGFDENRRWTYVLPTPNVEQRIEIASNETRLDELQRLAALYERLYVDLTVRNAASRVADTVPDDVQVTLDQYQVIYKNLLENYEAIRLAKIQSTPDLVPVEAAIPAQTPTFPNPLLFTTLGALLGGLAAGGLAFVLANTDEIFRTPEEARNLLRLPILAYVHDLNRLSDRAGAREHAVPVTAITGEDDEEEDHSSNNGARRAPFPLAADGLRFLRSNLEVLGEDLGIQSWLITAPGDTRSGALLAARLAQMVAHGHRKVILLDGDLRGSQIAQILELQAEQGLSEVLSGSAELEEVIYHSENGSLLVVSAGRPTADPADLVDREKLDRILEDLEQRAPVVIVNSPPFAFAEAGLLASRADAVVLAIQLNHTRSTTALAVMEQLQLCRANVVGLVIL